MDKDKLNEATKWDQIDLKKWKLELLSVLKMGCMHAHFEAYLNRFFYVFIFFIDNILLNLSKNKKNMQLLSYC